MRRLAVLLVLAAGLPAAPARAATPLGDRVDTRVGTDEGAQDFGTGGGAGATYPSAAAPFGLVGLSPDTTPGIRNYAGGYSYPDRGLRGFSLTHLSGVGCAGLGDVPLLPTTHAIDGSPSTLGSYDVDPRYRTTFTHDGEVARPGDYRVRLGNGVAAELTATPRTGALRLAFPATAHASVLVNAGGSAMGNYTSDLAVDPARREISGTVTSGAFCLGRGRYTVHFVARFDRPFAASGTWIRQLVLPGSRRASDRSNGAGTEVTPLQYHRIVGGPDALPGNPSSGAQAGAYATWDTRGDRAVVARVGLSTASVAGARRNLDVESGARGFAAIRAGARAAWERALGAVRVRGGSPGQRRLLTSMLYRALLMPTTQSDVDGSYGGMDGRVHRTPRGRVHYGNVSGWDVYRTQIPLLSMLRPRVAADVASSLLAGARESGHLPKWPLGQGQNNIMVGDPADLVIAGAHAFGATGFDARAALAVMVDGATRPQPASDRYQQRPGLASYLADGYVGHELNADVTRATFEPSLVWGSAATTLEYGAADFAIARMAAGLGDRSTCRAFARRSAAWRRLLDPGTRRIRPRFSNGAWATDDAPASDVGFVEGSEAQYGWAVPHDVRGLAAATGGRAATARRLRAFLGRLNSGPKATTAFLGNEPNLHVPSLFDWLGRPDLGAAATRRAMRTLYALRPGGYPGNDDAGTMAAWWVFGALGLYPAVPGTGVLALGAPLFPHATVRLARGTLRIDARGARWGATRVRSLTVGRRRTDRTWLTWRDVARGAHLRFVLARGGRWGRSRRSAPPSFAPAGACNRLRPALRR